MKKSLKLLTLATAIVAMSCCILKTNAESVKTATVQILEGDTICTGQDYDFGSYAVSPTPTTLTGVTHELECVLLHSNATNVQIKIDEQLSSAQGNHIPGTGFTVTTNVGQTNGSLEADTNETDLDFVVAKVLYAKDAYKVGELNITGVTINGTVPGGTPSGVYTGNIRITY